MNFKIAKPILGLSAAALFLSGCGSTAPILVSTPTENIDTLPLKISSLTEQQKKTWGHADLMTDTIPGMSVDKAYREIIGNKKGKKVIVAVMDSGIDLKHEDLDGVIWRNTKEIAGNNKDDDRNGYVDDIHGYNFLGESYNEQLEFARVLRLGIGDAGYQANAKSALDKDYPEALANKQQYEQIKQQVKSADENVQKALGKKIYTKKDVATLKPNTEQMQQSVAIVNQMFANFEKMTDVYKELDGGITYFTDQVNYNLNKDFDGRKIVGDNPYDINDTNYGNGNPMNRVKDESHGTHVAGIIAAERNNGKGVNGVANNVAIMSVRVVPNGD